MIPLALALAVAALLVPSANYQLFDGLPSSHPAEAVGLFLLLPLLLSRGLRRLASRGLRRLPASARLVPAILAAVVLAGKLALWASGTQAGFLACYQSPASPPISGSCERSYENPFRRFGVTRIDRRIDFRPLDWNLAFANSLRFNYTIRHPGPARRDRLPLAVVWRGEIEAARARETLVEYVGAGAVRLDGALVLTLDPSYERAATRVLPVPAGRHAVEISYVFADGSRTDAPPPRSPYATLRWLESGPGGAAAGPVAPRAPARAWRGLARGLDGLATLVVLLPIALYAPLLRPEWRLLGLVLVAGPGAYWLRTPGGWLPRGPGFLLLSLLVLGWLVARSGPRRLLGAYFAVGYLALLTALRTFASPRTVGLRSGGDDWLSYESQARSILDSWSLEAGEPLFYMQPGFRYIRFAERLLLGDGELLVATLALAALAWSVLWLVARLHRGRRPGPFGQVLFGLTAALLVAVIGSSQVTAFVLAPLSEYPTWIALALAFPLLLVSTAPGAWSAGALLLGVALVTRTNQAPAILFLLVVFAARAWTLRRRAAVVAGLIFALVALLPIVHNRYYGGRWVPLTTAAAVPAALVISPFDLPTLTHDAEARNTLWFQAQSVLALVPMRGERSLPLMLHGLQAAWLLALLRLLVVRGPGLSRARILMLLPLLYLGVHLFYIVEVYYPRHIVVGYLAMGVVTLYAVRAGATAARADRPAALRPVAVSGPGSG